MWSDEKRGELRETKEAKKREGAEERNGGQESERVRRGSHDPRLAYTVRVTMKKMRRRNLLFADANLLTDWLGQT